MKKYLLSAALAAIVLAGCGAPSKNTHLHNDNSECSAPHKHSLHDHSAPGHTHNHDHGSAGACPDGHDHSLHIPGSGSGTPSTGGSAEEIVFPAAQAELAGVQVEKVTGGTFVTAIKASGRIMPAQGDEVSLVAPVSGVVSFAHTRLAEGTTVGARQQMFHVSTRNIVSGDVGVRAAAAYSKARADFDRAEALISDRIISRREYDQAKLAYEQAKAEYDAIAGAQSARGTAVSTPISGFVASLSAREGDYVEVGQVLATVSQNRRLTLKADVPQRYYANLRSVRGANFTVPYDERTYALDQLNGRLLSVGSSAQESSSLLPVTFEFDNDGSVVPGTYVEAYLLGAPEHNVISVPVAALTEQQGLYYVYVQLDEECYQRREVKTGGSDGLRTEILSGLREGESVVTRGAVNIRMAAASGAIPHGHEH